MKIMSDDWKRLKEEVMGENKEESTRSGSVQRHTSYGTGK